jgi:hypothetical protein
MTSQVSDGAEAENRTCPTLVNSGAAPGNRICRCVEWLTLGYRVLCESEIPVEGPTAISVIIDGSLDE